MVDGALGMFAAHALSHGHGSKGVTLRPRSSDREPQVAQVMGLQSRRGEARVFRAARAARSRP